MRPVFPKGISRDEARMKGYGMMVSGKADSMPKTSTCLLPIQQTSLSTHFFRHLVMVVGPILAAARLTE